MKIGIGSNVCVADVTKQANPTDARGQGWTTVDTLVYYQKMKNPLQNDFTVIMECFMT